MVDKKRHSLVRTIYLYLFTLVGLALLIGGGVGFINMGLKAFVFTGAEEEQRLSYKQPPMIYSLERIEELQDDEGFSEDERAAIKRWLQDYKQWEEGVSKINYVDSRRQREAASHLAAIMIGLPLYLYHWGTIKTEVGKDEEE